MRSHRWRVTLKDGYVIWRCLGFIGLWDEHKHPNALFVLWGRGKRRAWIKADQRSRSLRVLLLHNMLLPAVSHVRPAPRSSQKAGDRSVSRHHGVTSPSYCIICWYLPITGCEILQPFFFFWSVYTGCLSENTNNKVNKTHLIEAAGESPGKSVCLFGAASLSFCWLLSVPSPHSADLQSYHCRDSPSSRIKRW